MKQYQKNIKHRLDSFLHLSGYAHYRRVSRNIHFFLIFWKTYPGSPNCLTFEKGDKDDQRAVAPLAPLLWRQAEKVGIFKPGEGSKEIY